MPNLKIRSHCSHNNGDLPISNKQDVALPCNVISLPKVQRYCQACSQRMLHVRVPFWSQQNIGRSIGHSVTAEVKEEITVKHLQGTRGCS